MLETVLQECPPTLKILDIRLPLTCDFATSADSIAQTPAVLKMMSQLEGLSVAVDDVTGRRVARYLHRRESSNHRLFPNRDHQAGFWRFLQVVAKVQMLSVRGADHLNFNIGPMLCGGLRELSLGDVEVSSRTLRDVVEKNLTELSAVELWRIELQSGTWAGVLTSFRSLQNLISFHMDSCGYMATGLSAHLRQSLLPEPDNPQAIETMSWHEDYSALGALQRHVNGRRATGGLQLYPEHEYRYTDMFE